MHDELLAIVELGDKLEVHDELQAAGRLRSKPRVCDELRTVIELSNKLEVRGDFHAAGTSGSSRRARQCFSVR